MDKKVALCFLISGSHQLNQEALWKKWIHANHDLFHIYFHDDNPLAIHSEWIRTHLLPPRFTVHTSYYHVVPAYLCLLSFALHQDPQTQWFCMLTESCVPIVSPTTFRNRFDAQSNTSLLKWDVAWWNVHFHTRANLAKFSPPLRLAHDPWFVLTRDHVVAVFHWIKKNPMMGKTICQGGLANESFFAVALRHSGILDKPNSGVINKTSTLTDWARREGPTRPHRFLGRKEDIDIIETLRKQNPEALFLRKVDASFPEAVLEQFYL